MSRVGATRLAWALWGTSTALLPVALVLALLARSLPLPGGREQALLLVAVLVPLALPYGAVGLLVALRRPANPLGWVFLGLAVCLGLVSAAYGYADQVLYGDWGSLPAGELAAWLTGPLFILAVFIAPCFVLLLFPDGRPPSPRWRPAVWLGVIVAVVAILGELQPGKLDPYPTLENPLGVGGSVGEIVTGLNIVGETFLAPLIFLTSLASMVARFRHAGAQARLQVKWVAYAAALMMASFVCSFVFGELVAPFFSDLFFFGGMAGLVGIPIAAGIAILRYRLYDIDVIINRTLVYGALTVTLAGAYLGSVLLLQLVLSPQSDLAIAGSTLAVAALVRPARGRIQQLVDRRFYRRRYDAAQTLESFGARLRDEVDLDALGGELRSVVGETMQPAHMSLWLKAHG